jgi:ABC-type glycerol-3-phosphate transport system substrate-binding protein
LFLKVTPDLGTLEEIRNISYVDAIGKLVGNDGELYGVPMGTGTNEGGMVYNIALTEEAGINMDDVKTLDDLFEAAKKLTTYDDAGNIVRSGVSWMGGNTPQYFFDLITTYGGYDKVYNPKTGEWNCNIPEAKKALEFMQAYVDAKIFDPTSGDNQQAFPNELCAMYPLGPWASAIYKDSFPDLKIGFWPFPKGTRVAAADAWGVFYASNKLEGEKKQATLFIFDNVLRDPMYYDLGIDPNTGGWSGIPGSSLFIKYLEDKKSKGEDLTEQQQFILNFGSQYEAKALLFAQDWATITPIVYDEIIKSWKGEVTQDEALTNMTQKLNEAEKTVRQ